MGSRGDCFDNAVAESFFATLKKELVNRRSVAARTASYAARSSTTSRSSTTANDATARSACAHPPTSRTALSAPPGRPRRFAARVPPDNEVHCTNQRLRRLINPCPPKRGKSSSHTRASQAAALTSTWRAKSSGSVASRTQDQRPPKRPEHTHTHPAPGVRRPGGSGPAAKSDCPRAALSGCTLRCFRSASSRPARPSTTSIRQRCASTRSRASATASRSTTPAARRRAAAWIGVGGACARSLGRGRRRRAASRARRAGSAGRVAVAELVEPGAGRRV